MRDFLAFDTPNRTRTDTQNEVVLEATVSANFTIGVYAPCETRTRTVRILSLLSTANWTKGANARLSEPSKQFNTYLGH